MENLSNLLDKGFNKIKEISKSRKLYSNDDFVINYLSTFYSIVYDQIHNYLVPLGDKRSESEIRSILREVANIVIPLIESQASFKVSAINRCRKKREKTREEELNSVLIRYHEIYDDFYALIAFRSVEHFALYMEWDLPERDKIWKYNLNCFHGFWYYATKLVLDGEIHFLEKQCPTGYGKSYADTVLIAFILGYDINADIMKVTGSPVNVNDGMVKLINYMTSKRYAKVFPYFSQFNGDESLMFSVCQKGGSKQAGKLLITGSRKGTSFAYFSKQMHIDGTRFKYRFYDDITIASDINNITAHEKDWGYYTATWAKRKYDDYANFEIASGTTYHEQDFLSRIKRRKGGESAVLSPVNKFTKINYEERSVFVLVPKLDLETGESTYPHKYKTKDALFDRANDYETFMAMDMQDPVPPQGVPFARKNLIEYDFIPHKDEQDYCWAVLDPNRTGANYVAMPIFCPIDGVHYLKDCIFELSAIDNLYGQIIEKIVKHKITKLHIECNTDTSLANLLIKMLKEQGIYFCEVTKSFTTKNKDLKISNMAETIKKNMSFPKITHYGASSQMGKFMKYFTSYTYLRKNDYDDSADALAMYAERFILGVNMPKVKILSRI